jgi:uncharacterized protein DUF1565
MKLRRLLALTVALGPWGCNALLGIEEATDTSANERAGTSGQAGSGGPTGSAGSGGSSLPPAGGDPSGAGGEGGAAPVAPCDAGEVPTEGVFVDARSDHGDDTQPGSQSSPLRTIGRAIAVAVEQGKTTVFLAPGTYAESLDVRAGAEPSMGVVSVPEGTSFRLEGGWQVDGARWGRDCDPTAREKTVIASTTPIGLTLQGPLGSITARNLSIAARSTPPTPADGPGASSYGVFAAGDGLRVRFENVIVEASNGASGGDASPGAAGVGVTACNVYTCGSGASGTDASASASAGAGEFTSLGFVPGDGGEGQTGGVASPGTVGPGKLEGCGKCNIACEYQSFTVQAQGACGCPGVSGEGGRRGRGGGASVAFFADGQDAEITLAYTTLRARDGGDGSSGGEGGIGADGSAGVGFASGITCCLNCTQVGSSLPAEVCASNASTSERDEATNINVCACGGQAGLPAQPAGGPGGRGGHGGKGGGGSGGPSLALVHTKTVVFQNEQSVLTFGRPGLGAEGAPDGEASTDKLFGAP